MPIGVLSSYNAKGWHQGSPFTDFIAKGRGRLFAARYRPRPALLGVGRVSKGRVLSKSFLM